MAQHDSKGGRKIRIVIAKPGLDGHDVGAKVVAHALKNAGMEVIYTGLHWTIDEIVQTALQEDADVIGLSIYSGAHLALTEKLMNKLRDEGISDKIVLVGGIIPARDREAMRNLGVKGVFPVGSRLDDIVRFITEEKGRSLNEKI